MHSAVPTNEIKFSKLTRTVFGVAVFCVLTAGIAWSVYLVGRLVGAERDLQIYVRLAAKSQASLNFQRGKFHLLAPEGSGIEAAASSGTNAIERIPVVSKWDSLYIKVYNWQMSAHLDSTSNTNLPALSRRP